jgi:hypothetical protein
MRVKVVQPFAIQGRPFEVGAEVDDSEFGPFAPEVASSVVPVTSAPTAPPAAPYHGKYTKGPVSE